MKVGVFFEVVVILEKFLVSEVVGEVLGLLIFMELVLVNEDFWIWDNYLINVMEVVFIFLFDVF